MTTDQISSGFRVSLACNFGGVGSAESFDKAQGAGMWEMRRHPRNAPAVNMRALSRRSGEGHCQSRTEQLSTSAHEDLSRLNEILRTQHCAAVMRGMDGTILPLNPTEIPIHGDRGTVGAAGLDRLIGHAAISTSIFDADGRALASLEIIEGDAARSESSEQLLRALVESAARAITERWFRLVHRRHCVVTAMRRNAPHTTILFAIDREQRIAGADRQARHLLEANGRRMGPQLAVSALFRPNLTLLRRRRHGDISTTLFASSDGEPWVALISPADPGVMDSFRDARVLLHVRPRMDSLAQLSSNPPTGRPGRGLSQAALQRIEEYIEANLDSALDIDELAGIARMSASHFTRSFHKSVGVTPHRYVIQNRVMRARELLATTNLPLTEIALSTGFSDQSHFSRRFHEIVGLPPGAFRGHDARSAR